MTARAAALPREEIDAESRRFDTAGDWSREDTQWNY